MAEVRRGLLPPLRPPQPCPRLVSAAARAGGRRGCQELRWRRGGGAALWSGVRGEMRRWAAGGAGRAPGGADRGLGAAGKGAWGSAAWGGITGSAGWGRPLCSPSAACARPGRGPGQAASGGCVRPGCVLTALLFSLVGFAEGIGAVCTAGELPFDLAARRPGCRSWAALREPQFTGVICPSVRVRLANAGLPASAETCPAATASLSTVIPVRKNYFQGFFLIITLLEQLNDERTG